MKPVPEVTGHYTDSTVALDDGGDPPDELSRLSEVDRLWRRTTAQQTLAVEDGTGFVGLRYREVSTQETEGYLVGRSKNAHPRRVECK